MLPKNKIRLISLSIAATILLTIIFIVRVHQIKTRMLDLVEGRKSKDAELIANTLNLVGDTKERNFEQQIDVAKIAINYSHSSTRVLISEKPGSYLFDNKKEIGGTTVPDSVSKYFLTYWAETQDDDLFVSGVERNLNGVEWHVVIRPFIFRKDAKPKILYTVLVTNVEKSIEQAWRETFLWIAFTYFLTELIIICFLAIVVIPANEIALSIKAKNTANTSWWWPKELGSLAASYNIFLENDAISKIQFKQSSSGQFMAVASESRNSYRLANYNEALASITGYSFAELASIDLADIYPSFSANIPSETKVASDLSFTTVDILCKNRAIRKCSIGIKTLNFDKFSPRLLITLTDVTDLIKSKEELEQLYRSLRHDIISSCKGISDMLELLIEWGFKPEGKFEEPWNLAVSKSALVYQLVANTGKIGEELKIEKVAVSELFEMLAVMFVSPSVTFLKAKEEINVEVDKNAFSLSVMGNIINNALKYGFSETGGVEVGAKVKEHSVTVYVKDHGVGLSAEQIKQILNSYGASARLNPDIAGTGTGLYSARSILQKHGLELKCKSQLGSGSIFYVEIPCVP